jgi:hypothetical protein
MKRRDEIMMKNIEKSFNVGNIIGKTLKNIASKSLLIIFVTTFTAIFGLIYLIYGFAKGTSTKRGLDPHYVK